MKQLPNLLSVFRIILSITLLFISLFNSFWLILYIICGLTDILDGHIARKYQLTSNLGSSLDSLADFIMITVILIKLLIPYPLSIEFIAIICVIAIVKLSTLLLGIIKFKELSFLHTIGNKFSGLIVFIFTPLYFFFENFQPYLIMILGSITLFAALEELLITITTKKLNKNIKSFFKNY